MYSVAHKISLSWLIAIVISLLCFFPISYTQGQTTDYTLADSIALTAPDSVESTVADLVFYFNQHQLSTLEKTRAAYRWITNEIAYDTDALFAGWPGSPSLRSVLRDRIALCKGYSHLFSSLLDALDIQNKIVEGDAKGATFNFSNPELSDATKHVWNSFKIDSTWYLADATFGAGYINHNQKTFVKHFSPSYFLSPPDFFIYSHFPNNPKWQLLENPISEDTFLSLPSISSYFAQYDIRFSDLQRNNATVRKRTDLTFKKSESVRIICFLLPNEQSRYSSAKNNSSYTDIYKNRLNVKTINESDSAKITMLFHEKRSYTLRVLAQEIDKPNSDFKVVAEIDYYNEAAIDSDQLIR